MLAVVRRGRGGASSLQQQKWQTIATSTVSESRSGSRSRYFAESGSGSRVIQIFYDKIVLKFSVANFLDQKLPYMSFETLTKDVQTLQACFFIVFLLGRQF
jgi:hypothetical protein